MRNQAPQTDSETVNCLRCGRKLTAAASISRRYGRGCAAKIRRAAMETALAEMTPAQAAKAIELISDGALVPMRRSGVYQVASSDGSTTYLTHTAGCSCPAGIHQRLCFHRGAVRCLEAAKASMRRAA
jgi:hypothetical protein